MKRDSRLSGILHALLYMVEEPDPVTSEMLAAAMHTNPVVMRRIMARLGEVSFVRSERGHGGGWTIARELHEITLRDIDIALGSPALLAIGNRTESPGCLVEQAVNAALDTGFRKAQALRLKQFGRVTHAALSKDFHARLAAGGGTLTLKQAYDIDVIIVGDSVAGLSAATYIARGRRSVCVIDAGNPRNRFATASHGFFSQDGSNPRAMLAQARAQLARCPQVTFVAGGMVDTRAGQDFTIVLAFGETLPAALLVFAHGISDVLPYLPGLDERWGKSALHRPYCNGYEFAERRLGVPAVSPMSAH